MAKIYNSDLTKGLQIITAIQQNREKTPDDLAEKIVPVVETNPDLLRKGNAFFYGTKTSSGNLTIGTTAADKDFYLTGIQVSYVKDAACDLSTGSLTIYSTANATNSTQQLAVFAVLTLTAQQDNVFIQFQNPIRLNRSTAITMGGTFTAGNLSRVGAAWGYYVENPSA